jgi:hypothetical protein
MPILLEDLIRQLPSDTEERIKQARERFNNRIREALRNETRFFLKRQGDSRDQGDEIVKVPVQLLAGLPEALRPRENQTVEDKYRLSILLAPYRHLLTALRDSSSGALQELIPTLRSEAGSLPLLDGRDQNIEPVWRYADFLLKKLNEFELTRFVLRVNSDLLGIYRYRLETLWDNPEPRVELYWGVIALIARDLGVLLEDLTCVVLAHELAHAYTHVGVDADNHSWRTSDFAGSMQELVEGLAQYYTERVCQRIQDDAPGAIRAYNAFLPHQPPAYQVHASWRDSRPEHIRLAMLEVRRSERPATLVQFAVFLKNARAQL